MPRSDVELKRWKRVEYERLVEKVVFATGDRVELIDGLLIVAEPQSAAHYTAIKLVERALARAFGEGWHVRSPAPIALAAAPGPAPDVARGRRVPLGCGWGRPPPRAWPSIGSTGRASTRARAAQSTGSST